MVPIRLPLVVLTPIEPDQICDGHRAPIDTFPEVVKWVKRRRNDLAPGSHVRFNESGTDA
jgi:hypothetical protein